MSVNEIRSSAIPTLHVRPRGNAASPAAEYTKTDQVSPAEVEARPNGIRDVLTAEEKEYFAKLFPGAAGDIRSYHPYQNNGTTAVTQVGTIVDRRG